MQKFPPVTPKHNRTTKSFVDTKRILKELYNDPTLQLSNTLQIEQQQEQSISRLVKTNYIKKYRKQIKIYM